jgi:amino acid transporter
MSDNSTKVRKKSLNLFDMTLFTFCAVFLIDTVPASAAIGMPSITWWIVAAVLYFLPYGLISAELGSTYPEQGGLYIWTKKAFGDKWAARTTWFYWVNIALWMPSVYVVFAGMFTKMFLPNTSLWGQVVIGIMMTWVTVWINMRSLNFAKWLPNVGAMAKLVVVVAMVIATCTKVFSTGFANDINITNLMPNLNSGLAFLPVIIYNLSGFELMSSAAGEMDNPAVDIPKAVIFSGLLITFFYIITTLSILAVIPVSQLSLVNGILDTLYGVFGTTGIGGKIVMILGIAALFTFIANMVTWTLGVNRVAVEAAKGGELPAVFGITHPVRQTPVGAAIMTGIVATTVFITYGLLTTNAEDLFWSLFKFSSIIFLIPYGILFPAFLKLRAKEKDIHRPYKVPGPKWFVTLLAVIAELFIIQSIVFFVWVPGQPFDIQGAAPIIIGTIITVLLGEFLIKNRLKKSNENIEGQKIINYSNI